MANTLGKYNPFRYRGYVYDEETGLYYLNSRYYDPELCRFISADSLAVPTISPGSASWDKNLYAYCDNDPVNRKDAGGECWVLSTMLIGGAIGAGIGAVTSVISQSILYGEVNWKTFGVDIVSGFVGGAVAASPMGMAWQLFFGASINAIAYNADCYVNNTVATDAGTLAAAGSGLVSAVISGRGVNFEGKIDSIMDNSAKKITNIKNSKNTPYVDKYVTRITNERNSVLLYTAVKASAKYTIGTFTAIGIAYAVPKIMAFTV